MVIRQSYIADSEPIDELEGFLLSQQDIVNEINQQIVDEFGDGLIDELSTDPGAVQYPIEWASDEQRNYYFGVIAEYDSKGNIIPYQRTGDLADGWQVFVVQDSTNASRIVVENPAPQAKFVYGSLAQDRTQALRFQQPFHRNTGWQPATDTVRFWFDAYDERFNELYNELIGEFGTARTRRRAFTR